MSLTLNEVFAQCTALYQQGGGVVPVTVPIAFAYTDVASTGTATVAPAAVTLTYFAGVTARLAGSVPVTVRSPATLTGTFSGKVQMAFGSEPCSANIMISDDSDAGPGYAIVTITFTLGVQALLAQDVSEDEAPVTVSDSQPEDTKTATLTFSQPTLRDRVKGQ